MRVSGEKFGNYSAGWDKNEKASIKLLKKAGIKETQLSAKVLADIKKRWSVIEPKWIKDAGKLGIDGRQVIKFYRNELVKIEGAK